MTNPSKTNPPAKKVQGLPEGTLRTTMTHLVEGDQVLVQTQTADPQSWWVPAPAKPTKRALWCTVVKVNVSTILVEVNDAPVRDQIILDYVAHTAVTIKDREAGRSGIDTLRELLTLDPPVAAGPTVTITGTHVHREARGGRAWCPVTVLDGDEISDDAARVTCPVCMLADTVPAEVVADAVYSYEAGSYVVYRYNAATGVSVAVPVADLAAHLAAEAAPVTACECGTLRCHGDGPCTAPGTVVNTAAGGRLVGYMCQGCQDRLDVAIPPTAPKSEPQRRAIRLLGELSVSGSQPQINGGTLKTLVRDGWVTIDTRKPRSVINLTGDALAWLASEHTAEVTPRVLGSGVTVYSATCNCGTGHENPRLARRAPWTSAGCLTAEDAVAVALGHGEVSRPQYREVTFAVGDRVEVLSDWTEDGRALPGVVVLLDSSAVWVEHAEGCAPLAYGAEELRVVPPGEVLAAQQAAGIEDGPVLETSSDAARVTAERPLSETLPEGADPASEKCECESVICVIRDAHGYAACQQVPTHRRWIDLCAACYAATGPEGTATDEERMACLAWERAERLRMAVRDVACEECGIMPHAEECLTGLHLDSPPVAALPIPSGAEVAGWKTLTDRLLHEPRTLHDDELEREHAFWETVKVAASLTADEVAGLQPVESVVEAHNAARPWSAKGGKRKGSSVAVKRQQQRAGVR